MALKSTLRINSFFNKIVYKNKLKETRTMVCTTKENVQKIGRNNHLFFGIWRICTTYLFKTSLEMNLR